MATKLEMWAELQPLIQKEIQDQLAAYSKKEATKYGVSSTPLHKHNGFDSPVLPPTSVQGFNNLPGTGTGVLAPENIADGRQFYWNAGDFSKTEINPADYNGANPTVPAFPFVIIDGDLGEESLDFLGGSAPEGTMIIYKQAAGWQLWVIVFGTWHGVQLNLTPA